MCSVTCKFRVTLKCLDVGVYLCLSCTMEEAGNDN